MWGRVGQHTGFPLGISKNAPFVVVIFSFSGFFSPFWQDLKGLCTSWHINIRKESLPFLGCSRGGCPYASLDLQEPSVPLLHLYCCRGWSTASCRLHWQLSILSITKESCSWRMNSPGIYRIPGWSPARLRAQMQIAITPSPRSLAQLVSHYGSAEVWRHQRGLFSLPGADKAYWGVMRLFWDVVPVNAANAIPCQRKACPRCCHIDIPPWDARPHLKNDENHSVLFF